MAFAWGGFPRGLVLRDRRLLRLLLFDPLAVVPSEIEELAAGREPVVVPGRRSDLE
jgi:hypothetical protein